MRKYGERRQIGETRLIREEQIKSRGVIRGLFVMIYDASVPGCSANTSQNSGRVERRIFARAGWIRIRSRSRMTNRFALQGKRLSVGRFKPESAGKGLSGAFRLYEDFVAARKASPGGGKAC